ncbi:MAG: tyrosine-type recombinase/integrase [Chloroflexota bacterium]|nr:tyrosine-type recombinase/integrase [Chloroflexota bacterium]
MARLTALKSKNLRKPGRYGDGNGLYLNIAKGGSKSWIQRLTIDGSRRDMGLGGYPAVSLAQARESASKNKSAVANGINPILVKRRAAIPTFKEAAIKVHSINLPTWRNPKHAAQWISTLESYVFPAIGDMKIDAIGKADVLVCLTPVWTSKAETARRVRQRMRSVFSWAMAHDYIETNPAGEGIDAALPTMPRIKAHHRSLPYQEVPALLEAIDATRASIASKLCMRFVILTACRSGEARRTAWDEVDMETATWTLSGARMKGGRSHRVPLSDSALEVLGAAASIYDGSGLVFPSPVRPGQPLSDMTLTKILRDSRLADRATVHGFRSSFRIWAEECSSASHAAMELSLAHAVGSAVEQAYMRSDLLEQRRTLMQQWANFLTKHPHKENCPNSDMC